MLFIVIARTVSGVHWLTDILGSVLLSAALILWYIYAVDRTKGGEKKWKK